MNKVKPGEKFQVKASDWNDIVDAVNYVKSLQNANGTAKNKSSMPSTCVYVKNTTAVGYSFFSAVPVGNFIGNPEDKGAQMLFSDGTASCAQFGIAQESIAPNAVGKVMLIGVTPANVTISNQDHKFAVLGGDGKLISAESGSTRILWAGEADTETGESYCMVQLGIGSDGSSSGWTGFTYDAPFKVAIINKALANPPEGGWTAENMPQPNYKICVYDGRIADDMALNTTTSDMQAGYATYNGVYMMCQGKEFALPQASKYLVLTIDANLQSETYTRNFELVDEVTCKNTDTKQQYPIAYISYSTPPAPPEGTELTAAEQAAIDANAHSIKQYFHNVPQLWSFKVCVEPTEPTGA